MSEWRRRTTSRLGYQSLLFTLSLIAILSYLSGCGPEQTNVGQTNGNNVPVNLNISMPQESAAASTSGSRFWATVQSWLPSLTSAWAATTADLSTLSVEVTGPGIPSPITVSQDLSDPVPGDVITFTLDVPVGPDRVFTVSGTDATRRKIFGGQSSPIILTTGQAASADITLTGTGVSEADPLTDARSSHTATRLQNGQVLVVGGRGANGVLASAELFDPEKNTWTPRTRLTSTRVFHTATLLQSGQVLAVGGGSDNGVSVELFNPENNSWTPRARLTSRREFHTATRLQNGQVLIVGGDSCGDGCISALVELFNPEKNEWTPRANLNNARILHTATLLQNGQVLVVGGLGTNFNPLASAELFDPTTNRWTTLATGLTDPRSSHTATLLQNGQVLVVGGDGGCSSLASAELFDPTTNRWTKLATGLTDARRNHTAMLLQNGQVVVVGGAGGCDPSFSLASAELFDPATNTRIKLATGLTDARESHTATLLQNGQVLVVGGSGATGTLASAELFDLS